MELITKHGRTIGEWLNVHVDEGTEVVVAVAYFHPDHATIARLTKARKVRVIVSGEFAINDPRILRRLSNAMDIQTIPPGSEAGRLHAKVILSKTKGGRYSALVGSANFTYGGLFSHDEVGVALDSGLAADASVIDDLRQWIDGLQPEHPNWNRALMIWKQARKAGRLGSRPRSSHSRCWILKTTEGRDGPSHWEDFKAEQVLAIGWTSLKADPEHAELTELKRGLKAQEAHQVWDFVREWKPGDLVLICRGYPANQRADVYLYGYAQVEPGFFQDKQPSWNWRLKWPAKIRVIERYLPKEFFAKTLGKGSLLLTVHRLEPSEFQEFVTQAEQEFGIPSPT